MKVLFVNDTSSESNPGCQAASRSILSLINKNGDEVRSIPLNYWSKSFAEVPGVRRRFVEKRDPAYPIWDRDNKEELDIKRWMAVRDELIATDDSWKELLNWADRIVVNGEGSLHHNSPRCLSVLALISSAVERGKDVRLVNATFQAIDKRLLDFVLPQLQLIHSRESMSTSYLQENGQGSVTCPDLAFHEISHHVSPTPETKFKYSKGECLFSPGVANYPKVINRQLDALVSLGYKPTYFSVRDNAEIGVAEEICQQRNLTFMDSSKLKLSEIAEVLRRFEFLVSGRHHINIFALFAGVPIVPLCSNTWKIEGTLKDVGYPLLPVNNDDELREKISSVVNERLFFSQQAVFSAQTGLKRLAEIMDSEILWN